MHSQLIGWRPAGMWVLALVLATGCTAVREDLTAAPKGRAPVGVTRRGTPSPAAQDLLLAQQFDMGLPGAGPPGFGCADDVSLIAQGRPPGRPLVWVSSRTNEREASGEVGLALGEEATLWLYGFPQSGPITVTVQAGGRTYTTSVKRVAELSSAPSPQEASLFNGQAMEVADLDDDDSAFEEEVAALRKDVLQSGSWTFLPPDPARTAIARSGRLSVRASSGNVRAVNEVPLRWDVGAVTADNWERSHRIAVYGYPVGTRVPIGLYRTEVGPDERTTAVLERNVGQVVMPSSRAAFFTVPQDVFRVVSATAGESRCLVVPNVADCVA
ncbi:hypothetical protein ACGFSI_41015 [Streptomyces virginiae]|uniref:hypothetical protein n=1 Tax=Streptomyces virginiae TaxID=1961 RepID=UPI00371936B7